MLGPTYAHDCEHCVYLGHFDEHDLYWCAQQGADALGHHPMPTVIARASGEPSDYMSGLPFAERATPADDFYPLRVALLLARDRGLA